MASASAAVLYAIVVGWNGSPAPDVPALRYADDDAAEYARLFRDAGARTTLLTELDADSRALHADALVDGPPTKKALLAALAAVDAEVADDAPESQLYLVYSGHGDVEHGEGFVMLSDGKLTRSQLYDEILARRHPSRIHVIVDACKSYFLVYARGDSGERRHHEAFFVDEKTPERFPRAGFLLSTSSDAESHEWEEFQGGIFSHEVRSALRGAADLDGDGSISYAELGAFVRRANQSIANPRYRPRVTVAPPAGDATGDGAQLLSWASSAPATVSLAVDDPAVGRYSIEDQSGRRLVDAHLGATSALLHLPSTELYLGAGADTEIAIPATPSSPASGSVSRRALALSTLEKRPRRVASRGALHQAFGRLFELPYGRDSVEEYLQHPDRPVDDSAARLHEKKRTLRISAGVLSASTLASGIGATVAAVLVRGNAASESQSARLAANHQIDVMNGAAIGLYSVGGLAAIAWAILNRWPREATRVTAAPGPGVLGASLSISLP